MARILGVDIPRNKALRIALRSLYGVGPTIAVKVLETLKIDPNKSSNDLTEEDTSLGAAGLVMAIVGGAIIPFFFGNLIDGFGFKTAFILTIVCYGYILFYGRFKTNKTV